MTEVTELLTRQEAADRLRVCLSTIKNLLRRGQLERVPVERRVLIPADSVEAYLRAHRNVG